MFVKNANTKDLLLMFGGGGVGEGGGIMIAMTRPWISVQTFLVLSFHYKSREIFHRRLYYTTVG